MILLVCYYEKNIKSDRLEQSYTNACQAGVKESSAHQSFGSDINPVRNLRQWGCLGAGILPTYKVHLYIKILSPHRGPFSVFSPTPFSTLRRVHQTFPPEFQETQRADDRLQHRLHGILRSRVHPLTHSPTLASGGSEFGDMHVHVLDSARLPHVLRELYCLEREYC